MSTGLKVLLDAAQYIEHQEKLKRSPITASNDIVELCYVGQCSTGFDIASGVCGNNVINTRTARNTTDLCQQVSSSAPAASARFHHVANGVIITNNSNSPNGNQLVVETKKNHPKQNNNKDVTDYEFTNINVGGAITTLKGITQSSKISSFSPIATNDETATEAGIPEDAFSSNSNSSTKHNGLAVLYPPRQTIHTLNEQQELQQQTPPQPMHEENSMGNCSSQYNSKTKTFRLVDSGSGGDIIVVSAAANKQMLLNDGLRVASPAATLGDATSKAISIPKQTHQQHQSVTISSKFSLINSTSAPSNSSIRYKTSEPLTPPPVTCRKIDDTHTRIRSFSLSHKIAANKSLLNNGDDGDMIIEDVNTMNCIGGNQSPSRQGTTGSHYLQMMSAQQAAVASQMMHVTPVIGGSGRRRTISSNSNGAGTREVHNKLEKNRRAHLKECYEQLKNQLPLKEDERKKTSNLAILGEAIKYVKTLKKKDQELEAEVEQLAKTKINSQLKLVSLKRELGPKYEQMFPGPFLDFDLNNCEKEHLNETTSLSSGRGSILYSSSSSLSSGGSNGSTTMSSPVGASISLPTALSPVISKTYINSNISNSSGSVNNNNSSNISMTSRSIGVLEHNQQHQIKTSSIPANTSPTGMLPANATLTLANGSIVNVNNAALSLTAKNISAMSLTRDSPTPSTPSPSPSSSSCISSSSSLISSSPPSALNGMVSGRSVTVSIPNNLKISGNNSVGVNRVTSAGSCATVGNRTSSTAAPIIATSAPANSVSSSNNAIMLQALRGCHLV
ncbi:uncharacterized protein [Eurosta solidaginis]|uniref:uncharacterized protein isoform X2 n=1 Tax=Eurosta solidaginis TaxID=178769 RepID=UPI0035311AE1